MPDKKLTDNEIVKTLEECIELSFDDTEYTTVRLDTLTNALDLITRQQAKNEELVGNNDKLNIELQSMRSAANSLKMHYEEAQAEIERLENHLAMAKKEIKKCVTHYKMACSERNDFLKQLKTAKSEAIKEFAEELKGRLSTCVTDTQQMMIELRIDNLLKELVGENDDR